MSENKCKPGPKSEFSFDEKMRECSIHKLFKEDRKLKGKNDPVWQIICNEMNNKKKPKNEIQPTNLYAFIHKNMKKIKSQLISEDECAKVSAKETNKSKSDFIFDLEKKLINIKNNALYKAVIKKLIVHPFAMSHWSMEAVDFANTRDGMFYFGLNGILCKHFVAPDGNDSGLIYVSTLGLVDERSMSMFQLVQYPQNLIPLQTLMNFCMISYDLGSRYLMSLLWTT